MVVSSSVIWDEKGIGSVSQHKSVPLNDSGQIKVHRVFHYKEKIGDDENWKQIKKDRNIHSSSWLMWYDHYIIPTKAAPT